MLMFYNQYISIPVYMKSHCSYSPNPGRKAWFPSPPAGQH